LISGIPGPAAVGAKQAHKTAADIVRRKLAPVKKINPVKNLHQIQERYTITRVQVSTFENEMVIRTQRDIIKPFLPN
jgi:hypothetical protein